MVIRSLRWRAQQAVRNALIGTKPDSPARLAYRVLRRLPGVSALWRRFSFRASDDWRDVASYAANKGTFAPSASPNEDSPSSGYADPDFFDALVACIETHHPAQDFADGPVVLVNNGLSAGGAERQIVFTLIGLKARGRRALFIGEYLERTPEHRFYLGALDRAGVEWRALKQRTGPGRPIYAPVARPVAALLSRMPAHLMVEILDLAAELKALRPSVVHLWLDETSTKMGLAALISGAPRVILSGRNVNPTHFNFYQPYMLPLYRALSRSARVTFSNNSRAGARSYVEWIGLPSDAIKVVYNAVDFSAWPAHDDSERRAFRASLGFSERAPLVAGVFRLADEKRPILWLEAATALKALRSDAVFAIAGDGAMLKDVERAAARLGLSGSLKLLGETPDVSLLYAAADVFFLASREEGTPNAVIEAQRYGLPIVSTDAGGASEAFEPGSTGILVKDVTARTLAQALDKALADQAFRKSARSRGPEFVVQRFGLDRMIDETLDLYAGGRKGRFGPGQ